MTEDKETRIREWINTVIALAVLIVIVFGYFIVKDIPPKLNEISNTNKTISINQPITITDGVQVWYFNSSSNETTKIK